MGLPDNFSKPIFLRNCKISEYRKQNNYDQ